MKIIKLLPFLYLIGGQLVFKRKYVLKDEVIIKFTLFFKVDFLTYYKVKKEYYITEHNNQQVVEIIKATITQLSKLFE